MTVDDRHRFVRFGLIAAGGILGGLIVAAVMVGARDFNSGGLLSGQDARAYWLAVRGADYDGTPGEFGAYLYSPAFAQLLGPILAFPWQQFMALWTIVLLGALLRLTGPVLLVVFLPLAFMELWGGNVHLLLTLAIVIGFRHPWAWSFVLLTKVTPGIGLLWFAGRRDWRGLGVALATTASIVAFSWLLDPVAWRAWVDMLVNLSPNAAPAGSIAVPLGLRLPFAALLVAYAGVTDRRWLVPVGALLAMPVLWWGSLSMLIAVVALERRRFEQFTTLEAFRVPALARRRHTLGEPVRAAVAESRTAPEPG